MRLPVCPLAQPALVLLGSQPGMITADPLSKVAEAAEKAQAAVKDIFTDDNVLEYCSLDERV